MNYENILDADHTHNNSELIKSANMLMSTFEPTLIWDWICELLASETQVKPPSENHKIFLPSPPPSFDEILSLTDFLLEVVSFVSNLSRCCVMVRLKHFGDLILL